MASKHQPEELTDSARVPDGPSNRFQKDSGAPRSESHGPRISAFEREGQSSRDLSDETETKLLRLFVFMLGLLLFAGGVIVALFGLPVA